MKTSPIAEIGKPRTSLGGVLRVDATRRVIDMPVGELDELIVSRLEEFHDGAPKPVDDNYMDRAAAAKFLDLSTAQIDKLCRDHGLPFRRVGDVKRFSKSALRAWVEAQGTE